MAQSGYTPLLIYGSGTASNVPLAANLTSSALGAELALNYADGKLYFKNSSGVVTLLSASGGGPAGGSNTQVQYNSSGVLAGSANLTFNGTTLTANTIGAFTLGGTVAGGGNQINNVIIGTTTPLAGAFTSVTASTTLGVTGTTTLTGVATLTANPVLSAGTANGVTYLNGSKSLTSGTGLVFDGTNLGIGVTPSAWGSAYKMLQANTGASFGGTGSIAIVGSNYYNDGASKYIGTGLAALYLQDSGLHKWYNAPSGTAGNAITFTQAMTLDASGNLLVGDTTYRLSGIAAAGQAIQLGSRTFIGSNASGDTSLGGLSGSNFTAIYSNGAEKARLDSSGFLGLNKTPARLLDMTAATAVSYMVSSTGTNTSYYAASNTGGAIYVGRENSVGGTFGTTAYAGVLWSEGAYPLVFATNNTERMRIDNSGNVGIGTSSPSTKLDVNGAITALGGNSPTGGFNLRNVAGTVTPRLTSNNEDGTILRPGASGAYIAINNFASSAELLRVTDAGNVGIGTTSPVRRLSLNEAASTQVWTGYSQAGTEKFVVGLDASGNPSLYGTQNAPMLFYTNNTERMRIDSSGNVGIGTASPIAPLHILNGAASAPAIYLQNGNKIGFTAAQSCQFGTWNGTTYTENMRIDSSGNLLVGTTSQIGSGTICVQTSANGLTAKTTGTANNFSAFVGARDTNDGRVAEWYHNLAGSRVGSISVTSSATAYNTSSDYRLKNTIAPMTGALAKVALLKPVTYKWNIDGSSSQGFIAHELQEVIPDCVTGAKDAVEAYMDEDGNEATRPAYQGVDTSFLVATLTAAIQELKALTDAQASTITALTARITALENK